MRNWIERRECVQTNTHSARKETCLIFRYSCHGEYKDMNGAALYKMEVAGFCSADLNEPLSLAHHTRIRTFEQRVVIYHDEDRLNTTFNFIKETALQSP
jgi:hypothetical protein